MDINLAMNLADCKSKEQFESLMTDGGVKASSTKPINKTQSNVKFESNGVFQFEALINNVCIGG